MYNSERKHNHTPIVKEPLHPFFDSLQKGIQIIDTDWRYVYVNNTKEKYGKTAGEELIGNTLMQKYPEIEQTEIFSVLKRCMDTRIPQQYETEFAYPDNSPFWFKLYIEPIDHGIAILLLDISTYKFTEEKLSRRNEELQNANSQLDRFVYSASHDLRSPLASILGLISFIEEKSKETQTLEYITMMRKSITRMGLFLHNMLEYSRNNLTEIKVEPIPIQQSVNEIVDSLRNMKEAEGIDFKVTINEKSQFFSDGQRFNTVMENLISNAIKYHKKNTPGRYIIITGKSSADQLHVFIKDNGVGIATNYHQKIFDMFFRLSGDAESTGIGLYIVKEMIEKLSGSIRINSSVGVGTSFSISLKNLAPHQSYAI
jgi:signal transduction histidine kinase